MQMRLWSSLWKIIKIAGQLEAGQKSTGTQEGERGQILIIHDWEESDIFLHDGHFCILNVVYQTIQIINIIYHYFRFSNQTEKLLLPV